MIWRCPHCHGELTAAADQLRCVTCGATFPIVGGIPDLRLPRELWLDIEADRAVAKTLAEAAAAGESFGELVRRVFAARPGFERYAAMRTRQLLSARDRLRSEFHGWLRPWLGIERNPVLDLGCGAGTLGAAAGMDGRDIVGVDASLSWLVVARRAIETSGGTPILAAALAESLPLADRSMAAVAALDVLEHVAQPLDVAREIERVLTSQGTVVITSPNRFSLAPEPHTGLWAVGWLPRRLQRRYVKWRTGLAYAARNLSTREAVRLLVNNTNLRVRAEVGPVPIEELKTFGARRAALARVYNELAGIAALRPLLLAIGPYCRIVGYKP